MAITHDALWNKAKVFIERAFEARNQNRLDEFQLWAALALELLAKAALGYVHPAFVVEPSLDALLVAFGKSRSTEFRTLSAAKIFERCHRMVVGFDKSTEAFCNQIAGRRNADLHSGHIPFTAISIEAWQPKYWQTAKLLLDSQGETLDSFVGSTEASAADEIISDATTAVGAAVRGRIARHRAGFAEGRSAFDVANLVATSKVAVEAQVDDHDVSETCPACGCAGLLAGTFEDEVDAPPGAYSEDDPPWARWVLRFHSSDSFRCTGCQLHLDGLGELQAGGVPVEFEKQEAKEYDDGDYGND